MLSRNNFFMLMTIGVVLLVFVTNVIGENLIAFGEKDGNVFYYDKDSIKRKAGIVKVWTQERFNKKNEEWKSHVNICKIHIEKESLNKCSRLYYTMDLNEINCNEDTWQVPESISYDDDQNILYSELETESLKYAYIVPASVMAILKNYVCK